VATVCAANRAFASVQTTLCETAGGYDAVYDIFFDNDRDRDVKKKKKRKNTRHRRFVFGVRLVSTPRNIIVLLVASTITFRRSYRGILIIDAITIEEKKKLCRTIAIDQAPML
jgi:hypothetical protein